MADARLTTMDKVRFLLELMDQDLELLEAGLQGEDGELVGQLIAYANEAKRLIEAHQERSARRARSQQSGPTGPHRAARSVRFGR